MLRACKRAKNLPRILSNKQFYAQTAEKAKEGGQGWKWLKERGHQINPCNSKLHPAYKLAGLETDGEEKCVQEAYAPESFCFGCGPTSEQGLGLQSFRSDKGLIAELTIPKKFQAFPGIINGGVVNTVFDCHGNWTAAIALMDRNQLPRPPFTLSTKLQVQYHEPTPPDTSLVLESTLIQIQEEKKLGADRITVELTLKQPLPDNQMKLLASGQGVFVKRGALRSL